MDNTPAEKQADERAKIADEMVYNREQFLAGYAVIVNISQAIRHVNVKELKRWLMKELAGDMAHPDRAENVRKLMTLMSAYDELRETMKATGIPRLPEEPPVA